MSEQIFSKYETYQEYAQDCMSMGVKAIAEAKWLRQQDEYIIDRLWGTRHGS